MQQSGEIIRCIRPNVVLSVVLKFNTLSAFFPSLILSFKNALRMKDTKYECY